MPGQRRHRPAHRDKRCLNLTEWTTLRCMCIGTLPAMPPLHESRWWTRRRDAGHLRLLLQQMPATGAAAAQSRAAVASLTEVIDGFIPRAPQRVVTVRRRYQPPQWTLPDVR